MKTVQVFHGPFGQVSGGSIVNGRGPGVIGSGKQARQPRPVPSAFESLEVSAPVDVEFRRSAEFSIEIQGEDNLLDFILTEVSGATLFIGLGRDTSFTSNLPLKVLVSGPSLLAAELTGSGDLLLSGLNQSALRLELIGSGDAVASGRATDLEVRLQGSGDINTSALTSNSANVHLNGSGDVAVFARERVKVRVSGSGDVRVFGNPANRDSKVSGSGGVSFVG